jgi:hypothetical protein
MPYFPGTVGGGGSAPAGSDYQIQFALAGSLAAAPELAWDPAAKALVVDRIRLRSREVSGITNTAIGENVEATTPNTVIVGRNMTTGASNAVILTNGGTPPTQQDCIVIGRPSLAAGNKAVSIGRTGGASGSRAVSAGYDAQATHSSSAAIGDGARSTKANRHVHARGSLVGNEGQIANADLAEGEFAIWYDDATSQLKFKAKDLLGTIRDGGVPLA